MGGRVAHWWQLIQGLPEEAEARPLVAVAAVPGGKWLEFSASEALKAREAHRHTLPAPPPYYPKRGQRLCRDI